METERVTLTITLNVHPGTFSKGLANSVALTLDEHGFDVYTAEVEEES